MPRKSAADLSVVRPATPGEPAPPPSSLASTEAALWSAIVESKPAGWFGADALPVLKEYVRASVACDALARRIEEAWDSADERDLKRLLDVRDREARRAAIIATKLRLTPQSRYSPRKAAADDRRADGPRPWKTPGA